MRALIGLIVVVSMIGCATVPKPQELVTLEQLREGKNVQRAQQDQPELTAESNKAHKKAVEAWDDEELEMAKHWAILGTIRLRTALTIIAQEEASQRVEQAKAQLQEVQAERDDLEVKIKQADEQITLHEQLIAARESAREKEATLAKQLSEAQIREAEQKRLTEAQTKISEAQLALKQADTVEAATYAKSTYDSATALLARAIAGHKAGNAADASASAEVAKARAEAAYQAAREEYLKAKKDAERQAENQALQQAAAAIGGVTVKMKMVGQTQQLILPVTGLFTRRSTAPKADKVGILNAIGELLKKYPSYPVIINGYTSYRVRRSQRYSVSQARAQAVASHFVSMGIPFKRMGVSGRGADDMVARKRSPVNDRVEVILLFQ